MELSETVEKKSKNFIETKVEEDLAAGKKTCTDPFPA